MNFILLQVEKKYSQQQTTPFCLALPSQSHKALLYHSKFAVVGRADKELFHSFCGCRAWKLAGITRWEHTLALAPRCWHWRNRGLPPTANSSAGRAGSKEPSKLTKKGAGPAQAGQGYQIHLLDCTCHLRSKLQGRMALDISEWNAVDWARSLLCLHGKSSSDNRTHAVPTLCSQGNGTADTSCHCTNILFLSFLFHINAFWKSRTQCPPRQINNLKNIANASNYFLWEPAKISSSYCWNNLFKGSSNTAQREFGFFFLLLLSGVQEVAPL